jgi:hypothetical protein
LGALGDNGRVSPRLPQRVEPPASALDPRFEQFRKWSTLLDDVFRIPGTNIRFGWDPIVGLIPGLGELASPLFTAAILAQSWRMRIPRIVLVRMVFNALIDAVLSAVPIIGNLADIGWRANRRNMRLLERHAVPGLPARRGDRLFVFGVLVALLLLAAVPIVVVGWVLWRFGL